MTEPFPEKRDGKDFAMIVAGAVAGSVPVIGAAAGAIIQAMPTSLAKRQAEWFNDLAQRLEETQKLSITLEDIKNNGPVLDAILEAARVAVKTQNEEKRRALVNCVMKAVEASSIDRARLQMTISRLDTMTEWHLRLLRLSNNPGEELKRLGKKYETHMMSSIIGLIEAAYPELNGQKTFVQEVWKELHDMGFVGTDGIMVMMSASGALGSGTTEMGKQIIQDCFG